MAWEDPAVVVASAARTTSGNSGSLNTPKALQLGIFLSVTAQSGTTPTLDVSVEWSMDGATFGAGQPADSFTQITTATPTITKQFAVKAPFYRVVWVIAGTTPSYTFTVSRYGTGM